MNLSCLHHPSRCRPGAPSVCRRTRLLIEQEPTSVQRGGGSQGDQTADPRENGVGVSQHRDGGPPKESTAGSHGEAARLAVGSGCLQGIKVPHDVSRPQEDLVRSHGWRRAGSEDTEYRNLFRHAQRYGAEGEGLAIPVLPVGKVMGGARQGYS